MGGGGGVANVVMIAMMMANWRCCEGAVLCCWLAAGWLRRAGASAGVRVRDKEDCAAEGEAWQRLARVEVVGGGGAGWSVNESKYREREE